jgi:hypothetical protein
MKRWKIVWDYSEKVVGKAYLWVEAETPEQAMQAATEANRCDQLCPRVRYEVVLSNQTVEPSA